MNMLLSNYCPVFLTFISFSGILTQVPQQTCQVPQPTGWEEAVDTSGLRPSSTTDRVVGESVFYNCPGVKAGESDGKNYYKADCIENTVGLPELEYEFGTNWPTCACPQTASCEMTEDSGKSTSQTRYTNQIEAGGNPGTDVWIPLPEKNIKIKEWTVEITWDIATTHQDILVTSQSEGILATRLDFLGQVYSFRPINKSYIGADDGKVHISLFFNFRNTTVRGNNQKWHYPCIQRLECELEEEEGEFKWYNVLIIVGGLAAVVFFCGLCCAAITWCLQHDTAYGVRPYSSSSVRSIAVVPHEESYM